MIGIRMICSKLSTRALFSFATALGLSCSNGKVLDTSHGKSTNSVNSVNAEGVTLSAKEAEFAQKIYAYQMSLPNTAATTQSFSIVGGAAPDTTAKQSTVSVAAVLTFPGGKASVFCSGVVIGLSDVLTAAHCVDKAYWQTLLGPSPVISGIDYFVGVGDKSSPDLVGGVPNLANFASVKQTVSNPGYLFASAGVWNHDLALIKTVSPIGGGKKPIRLTEKDNALKISQDLVIAGYGNTSPNGPNALSQGMVTVQSVSADLKSITTVKKAASGYACLGDSGAPLMEIRGAISVLIGIHSGSKFIGAANLCNVESAKAQDLRLYSDWIRSAGGKDLTDYLATSSPAVLPTIAPTPKPTVAPTPVPSVAPSPKPSVAPVPMPSIAPVPMPSIAPAPMPSIVPMPDPVGSATPPMDDILAKPMGTEMRPYLPKVIPACQVNPWKQLDACVFGPNSFRNLNGIKNCIVDLRNSVSKACAEPAIIAE